MRAAQGFAAMKRDRLAASQNEHVFYATFDMQKTMPLPKLSTGDAFYLRQFWLYNVGIHLTKKGDSKAFFHIWSEDEGLRGCEEVASCLLTCIEAAGLTGGHITFWSDSCGGQNKNFFIICFWQYLICKKQFETIDHKFPEPGHSYMDSDRDFAKVEKEVRLRENIYSVDEYHTIIAKSQKNTHVTRMAGKFVELKRLPDQLGLVNRNINTQRDGSRVYFRDIKWIRVEQFGSYKYRMSHDDQEPWKAVNILKANAPTQCDDAEICPRHQVKSGMKAAKVCDIKKQLKFIPAPYRSYYESVISSSLSTGVREDDDVDSDVEESAVDLSALQHQVSLHVMF